MTDWSRLVPPGGPREVERKRAEVEMLEGRLRQAREAIRTAKARLTEVEQQDRMAMSQQLRSGAEPVSDTSAVAKARERVDTATRTAEAGAVALAAAEAELGEAARSARGKWADSAGREEKAARERARGALDILAEALSAIAHARSVRGWLEPDGGLDREGRAPKPILMPPPSTAALTANAEPLPIEQLLAALAELIDPPAPREPPPVRPLRPAPSASMGAITG